MPKIIKDLEENIFEAAFQLFSKYGYKDTDMKKIAKEVGIAVGTLYNYYPNKNKLFEAVFQKSWSNTFLKVDEIIEQKLEPFDKLKLVFKTLYIEIEDRNGLGNILKESATKKKTDEILEIVRNNFLERINKIFDEIEAANDVQIDEGLKVRIITTFMVTVTSVRIQFSDEKEQNMKYIDFMVDCIFSKLI